MRNGSSPFKRSGKYLIITLIATICVAIFFPILNYGWLSIEDTTYYGTNPLFGPASLVDRLRVSWTVAPESNYMPLTWNLTILLSEFSNHNPKAFHLASLLLHALNSCLALIILKRLKIPLITAGIITLLFAIHPLRVESVAWASSIKGLLACFFTLLTLYALISDDSRINKLKIPLIVFFFLLSLLCKQTLFLLPIVIYLITLLRPEFRLNKIAYTLIISLAVLAAATASWINADNTMLAINQFNNSSISPLKALAALGHYIQQQFIPIDLAPEYPVSKSPLLITIGIVGLAPLILWFHYIKHYKERPLSLSLVCYTSFIILLLPVLGLIATPLEFAADRLTYLPSLFFWSAIVLSLHEKIQSLKLQNIWIVTCGCLLVPFYILTSKQVAVWKNDKSLTDHILQHSPEHFLANLQVSNQLAVDGQFNTALSHAETLINSHPYRYAGWQTFARIHMSLGSPETALLELNNELEKDTPIQSGLTLLKIEVLRSLKRYPEALNTAELALSIGADQATVHYHNAQTHLQSGDLTNAKAQVSLALKLKPNSPTILSLKQEIDSK